MLLVIDAIGLIIATFIAFFIYNRTRHDLYLIGATGLLGNALYTIYGVILNMPNMWIHWTSTDLFFSALFILFVAMSYLGVAQLLIDMYKDRFYKSTIAVTTIFLIGTLSAFIINHNLFAYTGYYAIAITVIGLYWITHTPRKCHFDPWCNKEV